MSRTHKNIVRESKDSKSSKKHVPRRSLKNEILTTNKMVGNRIVLMINFSVKWIEISILLPFVPILSHQTPSECFHLLKWAKVIF